MSLVSAVTTCKQSPFNEPILLHAVMQRSSPLTHEISSNPHHTHLSIREPQTGEFDQGLSSTLQERFEEPGSNASVKLLSVAMKIPFLRV